EDFEIEERRHGGVCLHDVDQPRQTGVAQGRRESKTALFVRERNDDGLIAERAYACVRRPSCRFHAVRFIMAASDWIKPSKMVTVMAAFSRRTKTKPVENRDLLRKLAEQGKWKEIAKRYGVTNAEVEQMFREGKWLSEDDLWNEL